MVLRMSRPQKHPKTGIFQFRKRVPSHLQALVGKKEEKTSLGTRDPAEARILHARMLADVEARWRQLSYGRISLSQKQAEAIAGEIYREMVANHEENPGSADTWRSRLLINYATARPERVKVLILDPNKGPSVLKRFNDRAIQAFLSRHGMVLDDESMDLVRLAVRRAVIQAQEHLTRLAGGDYRPDPDSTRFPPLKIVPPENEAVAHGMKFELIAVFEAYAMEKVIAASTYKKWKLIIGKVAKEVPDIRNLTRTWVIEWKDRLVASGLAKKSVKESYLASLRAVCTWGVANGRINDNPVNGVTVSIPKFIKTREKYFTPTEANTILVATMEPAPEKMSQGMKDARRWIPWLCAYTGARVGEVSQLRKQDIEQHGEHWLIWITPEAGSTKDSNPRRVAVHRHLVDQGFLKFVASKASGPLFYDPALSRGGSPAHTQHNKVGEKICSWVRDLGIVDKRIRPNHAWRHLFKTVARSADIEVGARDYMMGHVPQTEGEAYGAFLPDVLVREMNKFPYFDIEN